MKTLIAYYSLTGNADSVAQKIAQATKAELLKLKPQKDIKGGKVGFFKIFKGAMQALMKKTPKLENAPVDLAAYDKIVIGTPNWAGMIAPAVRSFLTFNKLDGKKVYLFATAGSVNPGKVFSELRALLPAAEIVSEVMFVEPLNADIAKEKDPNAEQKLKSFIESVSK
jgi:flavodoxin